MLVSMFLSVRYFKMVILKSHFKKAITKLLILTFLKIYRACVCENSHSSFFIDVFSILRIFFFNEVQLSTFSKTNYRKMPFNKELNKF